MFVGDATKRKEMVDHVIANTSRDGWEWGRTHQAFDFEGKQARRVTGCRVPKKNSF